MTNLWHQIIITCHAQDVSSLTAQLKLFDAQATSCLDAADQPLYEPMPGEEPLWQEVQLVALFDKAINIDPIVNYFVSQDAVQAVRHEDLPEQDWERAWMDDFKPMCFGSRLWICPSWCEPPSDSAVNLRLDPGLAFGTGTHATTALCLEWLDNADLNNKTIVDYGCGSGVLAVAGLLLGAKSAVGIDIDPQALDASRENAKRNSIEETRLTLLLPEQISDSQHQNSHQDDSKSCNKSSQLLPGDNNHDGDNYLVSKSDIVIANILAEPLKLLSSNISGLLKPGGQIVLSGILEDQAQAVMDAYPNISFESPVIRDGWVRLSGEKNK